MHYTSKAEPLHANCNELGTERQGIMRCLLSLTSNSRILYQMHSRHHVVINLTPGQAEICCYFTLQLEAFPWQRIILGRTSVSGIQLGWNE